MRGDDAGKLVVSERFKVVGGGQVLRAPVWPRKRRVGDFSDEALEKPVLPTLWRAWVDVDRQELFANEVSKWPLKVLDAPVGERSERRRREAPSEHGCLLEKGALLGEKRVESGGDEPVQTVWNLEVGEFANGLVAPLVLNDEPLSDKHPHDLHRVERNALCPLEDLRF